MISQESKKLIEHLLTEHYVALRAIAEYHDFLINQSPKFRLEEIEDEMEFRKDLREYRKQIIETQKALDELKYEKCSNPCCPAQNLLPEKKD